LTPGVRCFIDSEITTFIKLACDAVWWDMGFNDVADYVKDAGSYVPPGTTFFELLWTSIKDNLGLSDEATLAKIFLRISYKSLCKDASSTLLSSDEALEVLEPMDERAVKVHKEDLVKDIAAKTQLAKQYFAKAKELTIAREKREKTEHPGVRRPARRPLPAHIDQKEAKEFLPPGAYIWRSHTRGEWNAHLPGTTRVWEPFIRWGSSERALRECLKRVWGLYLEMQGLDRVRCPWKDLFDDEAA